MQLIAHRLPKDVQSLVIAPLGDIQWAGRLRAGMIALTALREHIARAVDQGAWFIGMGDMLDFLSPSNRQRLKGAQLYDTAEQVIEDASSTLVEQLYEDVLAPTTGRWLGLLEGHHFATYSTGETSDHHLCRLLKAPFLGTSAYVGVVFQTQDGPRTYTIWCHHGTGGGQKAHAPILKLENLLPYWDADLFLIGHMTRVAAAPIKRIAPTWGGKLASLQERTIHVVGTGGWLKGYAQDAFVGRQPRGNYVEQKMLNPVTLGAPIIRVNPKTIWINGGSGSESRKAAGLPARRLWTPNVTVEL